MMSQAVPARSRMWNRVVCVFAPGTGRHRIYAQIEKIDADRQREHDRAEALSRECEGLKEQMQEGRTPVTAEEPSRPELSSVTPEDVVCPPEEISVGSATLTDIQLREVARGIQVRHLSDVPYLRLLPQQKKGSGQGS